MKILLLEPWLEGSHQAWAEGYRRHSKHQVDIAGLSGRHWKWRMHGAAVTLARRLANEVERPDLILASDMLDLATFRGLSTAWSSNLPFALYFHESQLTYPSQSADERDQHYAWINFTSALAADRVFFNSDFHQQSFFKALETYLSHLPAPNEQGQLPQLQRKSSVLPLGLELIGLDGKALEKEPGPPILLWNHRWEHDKNPETFFEWLFCLKEEDVPYRLIVTGKQYNKQPPIFAEARERLADHIIHWGYASDRNHYTQLLHLADLIPVTAHHDFFGISVVEAIYCGCRPLLPHRLAYPSHLPPQLQNQYLYEDVADGYARLKQWVLEPQPAAPALREKVATYDWTQLGSEYDRLFTEMTEKHLHDKP